jgi:hypothetical protein
MKAENKEEIAMDEMMNWVYRALERSEILMQDMEKQLRRQKKVNRLLCFGVGVLSCAVVHLLNQRQTDTPQPEGGGANSNEG